MNKVGGCTEMGTPALFCTKSQLSQTKPFLFEGVPENGPQASCAVNDMEQAPGSLPL